MPVESAEYLEDIGNGAHVEGRQRSPCRTNCASCAYECWTFGNLARAISGQEQVHALESGLMYIGCQRLHNVRGRVHNEDRQALEHRERGNKPGCRLREHSAD